MALIKKGKSVFNHNMILIHLITFAHPAPLIRYKLEQNKSAVSPCVTPHLSIHLRYASDLDIIQSCELGCNLLVSSGGGMGGVVCPTLTDVAARRQQPPEDDNLRPCEQYVLITYTRDTDVSITRFVPH